MNKYIFTNDNNVEINILNNNNGSNLSNRINSEKLFRTIITFMINNNMIENNIIDSGSWIGDNSIPWAKNINGIVYAIDPSNENLEFIKSICEINNISNITTIETALSDRTKTISTNDESKHFMFQLDNSGKYQFNSCSLDDLYEKNSITNIGYVHLDVEGFEMLVIKGAEKLITDYRPIISFEQHIDSDDYMGIANNLKEKKYNVYIINEKFEGCRIDCRNLLAIPEEKNTDKFIETFTENLILL
jgi:FkbM family methyltransferase